MAGNAADPYVLGAWILMCRNESSDDRVRNAFESFETPKLIRELTDIMHRQEASVQASITDTLAAYGISFDIMPAFNGAPVQGFITARRDGTYRMFLTLRDTQAETFWFSLFHELGHLVNGDAGRNSHFLDDSTDMRKEEAADSFARECLEIFTH